MSDDLEFFRQNRNMIMSQINLEELEKEGIKERAKYTNVCSFGFILLFFLN